MGKKIRFYTSEKEAKKAAKDLKYKVFYLQADNWNDYGYRTLFVLKKVNSDGTLNQIGAVKIAEMNQESFGTELPAEPFSELADKYFSLGLDGAYYKKLKKFGLLSVLTALNDVAYIDEIEDCKKKCKQLGGEEVFNVSLLRYKDLATVERDFRGIVKDDVEPYEMISFSYLFNSEGKSIDNGYSSKELKYAVKYNDFPSSNIHVLIGANGVGKTCLLNNFIKSYIFDMDNTSGTSYDFSRKNDSRVMSIGADRKSDVGELRFNKDNLSPEEELSFTHITYVPVDLTVGNNFFCCVPKESEENIVNCVDIFNPTGSSLREKEDDDSDLKHNNYYIKTYSDLLILKKEEGERTEKLMIYYKQLLDVLDLAGETFIPCLDDYVRHNDGKGFIEWISRENLRRLSSGQLKVLYLFYSMTNIGERGLYVIDEPENSLHAPLLSAFMYVLRDVLVEENALAIIATHSPVALREVPQKCVHVLRSREGLRYVTHPSIETFGENLGVLLNEVFGVNADKSGYFSFLKDTVKKIPKEKVEKKYNEPFSEKNLLRYCIDEYGGKLGMEARALFPYIVNEAWLEIGSEKK